MLPLRTRWTQLRWRLAATMMGLMAHQVMLLATMDMAVVGVLEAVVGVVGGLPVVAHRVAAGAAVAPKEDEQLLQQLLQQRQRAMPRLLVKMLVSLAAGLAMGGATRVQVQALTRRTLDCLNLGTTAPSSHTLD